MSKEGDLEMGVDNPALELHEDGVEKPNYNSTDKASTDDKQSVNDESVLSKIGSFIEGLHKLIGKLYSSNRKSVTTAILAIFFVYYNAHLLWAIIYALKNEIPIEFCDGLGFLIIITAIVYFMLLYFKLFKPLWGNTVYRATEPLRKSLDKIGKKKYTQSMVALVFIAAILIFLIIDTANERRRLISFCGIIVLTLFGFIFSKHPGKVVWRHVMWGLGLQFVFGLLILRWPVGKDIFDCLGDKVATFLAFTDAGSGFVFGYLVSGSIDGSATFANVTNSTPFSAAIPYVFAFKVLCVIFFFSFCINILYHLGWMQWVVIKLGWLLQISVGTTACESMNASANIFLGQTEAPLLVKPFLPIMTNSELHAVMTGGFATIAGTVLAAYISFGIDPAHLLSASVMSAPAALAFSKLFYPETKESKTKADDIQVDTGEAANILDAASQGASAAIKLVANIVAGLIAFLAFKEFVDAIFQWMFGLVGHSEISFLYVMGKIFTPVAFIMGVDWDECEIVGKLIATKTIVNEFVGYADLGVMIDEGTISKRAEIISTYALCGFSNIASIGIQLGGLGALAPSRKDDLSKIAFRAFISGTIACLLTACIAGTLVETIENTPTMLT